MVIVTVLSSRGSLICPGWCPGKDCPDLYTRGLYSPLYTVHVWCTAFLRGQPGLCLLCPKYCLLCPIVKITHSDRGEKNHNWKIILKREKSRKNRKVQIDKIDFKESTNRRNLTQPWHASDNHTAHIKFLRYGWVWRWLISLVLNTMQTGSQCSQYSCYGQCELTPDPHRSLLGHDGGKLSGDIVTSDIWIQFNQIFMSSDVHYQDILQTKCSQCDVSLMHVGITAFPIL